MVGIVSNGFYLPKYRISVKEITGTWGKAASDIEGSLKVFEKTVSSLDEDSLTMAFESASMALSDSEIDRQKIASLFFGTESPPYAVNPASTILGEYLGIGNDYLAYDTQFACKAGTGALVSAFGLVEAGYHDYSLVVASDKATGRPNDALEFTAASGSVSLLVGKEDLILELVDTFSYSSDTPDFWRRGGIKYPSHAGRFSGEPAYFRHIQGASKALLEKTGLEPKDFQHAVFHMPNGKFPQAVAKMLGFEKSQIEKSLVSPYLGNSYTGSALMGLMSVLEIAKPGELIFMCSYGSGAGSDAFVFKVADNIEKRRREFAKIADDKEYLNYIDYRKYMGTI
jgi:hydroxymethylglutaryl-CoA synthase